MTVGANVSGVVRAPIDQVWERFRKFGPEIQAWWPIYEWVKLDAPGQDEVGCIRSFRTSTGREYKEQLVTRDEAQRILQYTLVEVKPSVPTLSAISTTIEMQAKGPNETLVHWTSEVTVGAVFAGKVVSTQEEVYRAAIASLDRSFNPSLGTLEVKVIGASGLAKRGLFAPDPFVVVDLDRNGPKNTRCATRTYNPTWNELLPFDVLSLEGDLRVSVWDARALGPDEFLGSAAIDLHELASGQTTFKKLKLAEVPSGELAVSLTLKLRAGDHLAFSEAVEQAHQMEHMLHVLGGLKGQAMEMVTAMAAGDPEKYEYVRYPRDPNFPDVPLEDLPRMVKGYPAGQLLPPRKLGRMTERASEYVYSQAQFVERLGGDDRWKAIFGGEWLAQPEPRGVIDAWKTDAEFCRQLLAGVNPMCITQLTDAAKIPPALAGLTAQGKSAADLAGEKRLFVLDYAELAELPRYRDMVFYAPLVLIYRELLEGGGSRLAVLGFQLERGADPEVFVPGLTPPNRYLLAKLHVACADNQYHQFIYHLGFAHLAMEPFAIAHHNAFPKDHPIGRLLAPHFRDTIGINTLARQTLVSPIIPFTDRTFSPGTTGALRMFLSAWRKWDFFGTSFPEHLAARGFDEAGSDGVEGYHYRDDGFKIWNALLDYVGEVVSAVYPDDDALAADPVIQAWAAESVDPERGAIPGFPGRFTSRELLTRAITTIIFTVSAQHSAVNFPQFEYLSYLPNRPDSMFREMPADRGEVDEAFLQDALPDMMVMQFQVSFAYLLTMPSEHPLSDLEGARDLFPSIHEKYVARLRAVSAEIQARNAKLTETGGIAYPYLQPERIAASIDI